MVFAGIFLVALGLRSAATAVSPILLTIEKDIHFDALSIGLLGMLAPFTFAVFGALAPFMARRMPVPQEENDEELIGAKAEQPPQWDGKPESLAAFMEAAKAQMERKSQPARPEMFDLASNSSQNSGLPSTLGGWNQVGMDTTHKRVHGLENPATPTGGLRTMK